MQQRRCICHSRRTTNEHDKTDNSTMRLACQEETERDQLEPAPEQEWDEVAARAKDAVVWVETVLGQDRPGSVSAQAAVRKCPITWGLHASK